MLDSLPPLVGLGFTPFFHQQYLSLTLDRESELPEPERIAAEQRSEYVLMGAAGTRRGVLSGRLRHALHPAEWPCVGDWVLTEPGSNPARIDHVFSRSSLFARKESGRSAAQQPIAANVDVAFVVAALSEKDSDPHAAQHGLNVRRIERYLRAAIATGVRGVVVLNKADLHPDATSIASSLRDELAGADVVLVSAKSGEGLAEIRDQIGTGETAVLVGSSGTGKSSLTNRLLERDAQAVTEVRRSDTRGRHTTTRRELFVLPSSGVLIDTPGMREFSLWADEDTDLDATGFEDIDTLAAHCRYRDCRHEDEPGCAVRAAMETGALDESRLESAVKLRRELAFQKQRQDGLSRRQARLRQKALSKQIRTRLRAKGRS